MGFLLAYFSKITTKNSDLRSQDALNPVRYAFILVHMDQKDQKKYRRVQFRVLVIFSHKNALLCVLKLTLWKKKKNFHINSLELKPNNMNLNNSSYVNG